MNVEYNNINYDNFDEFYEILEEAFPPEERRGFDNQYKLLDDEMYNILGLYYDNSLVAFITYWDMTDFIYVEHFAVKNSFRNKKIGSKMLEYFLKSFNEKVILEVEVPEDEITRKRVNFYKRHNFQLNEFYYLQPPYEEGKDSLELKIMSYPKLLTDKEFNNFKEKVYRKVYKVKEGNFNN